MVTSSVWIVLCILHGICVDAAPTAQRYKTFSFTSYYGDHMVLQKAPKRANIWGYAASNELIIIITIKRVGSVTTTSYNGSKSSGHVWSVHLPAVKAGGPYDITATSKEGSISLIDILFGDVWLCSGQSNMQFTVSMGYNASAEIADADNYPNIRVFTVGLEPSTQEQTDLIKIAQPWSVSGRGSVGGPRYVHFSAVCWFYGKYLHSHLKYPVGLVATSYDGTPIEAWSSPTVLKRCGVVNVKKATPPQIAPSVLWNAMIHPLTNMTIFGAIWYQGENDANIPRSRDVYTCVFPTMINDWRERFHQGSGQQTDPVFPFGFVQLGAWKDDSSLSVGYPDVRWHQSADYGYVPNEKMKNVFMSVAMDLPDFRGTQGSIHPRDKQDVAMRLATAGLAVAYNQSQYSKLNGPFPVKIKVWATKSSLQIHYDTELEIRSTNGFEITFISLRDVPAKWFPVNATAHDITTVTLDYSKLSVKPDDMVAAVRYAWRESPCAFKQCAVYNKRSGYPGPPFIKHIYWTMYDIWDINESLIHFQLKWASSSVVWTDNPHVVSIIVN